MTTLVVGGHSRKVGKTSVAAGLIAAFPQYPWTAMKISSHWHGGVSAAGVCDIHEEYDSTGRSDSSRFLAAGASRSLWVRVREGGFEAAMQRLYPILQSSPFLIIESNRILQYVQPDLYILVVRYDIEEFKDSARDTLQKAHAIVAVNYSLSPPAWKGVSHKSLAGIPLFATENPLKIPAGLLELVKSRLPIEPLNP
jgi:hypothetical protein